MKLIEGMEVTINSGDVGIYIGERLDDPNNDGRVSGVLYSGGEINWARQSEIEICNTLSNQRLVKFVVEKLRYEIDLIEWEIYELEAEERYDD